MAKGNVVIFVAFLFLVVAQPPEDDQNYSCLFLVFQVNKIKIKGQVADEITWTLHGLWGEKEEDDGDNFKYSGYTYCDPYYSVQFSQQSPDFMNRLELTWPRRPDSTFFTDVTFWNHEVRKHGSCLKDILKTPTGYLKKATDLFLLIGIDELLSSYGKHRAGNKFNKEDIMGYINNVRPLLECDGSRLTRITYCFKKSFQLKDCLTTNPNPAKDCPDQVFYYYD